MAAWKRVFAHADMDAFYASVEIRDDPSLAGKPLVVGGLPAQRGVVSAASYEARRYGIHSAMPTAQALRRCPQLVVLPVDFDKYRSVSAKVMEIFEHFSPVIEPLSLDEAFLDLTGTQRALGDPADVGRRIKEEVRAETRLTVSVGIAPVKFIAKIASDLRKPDGLVVVEPDGAQSFLDPLPIGRLWGVGPRTREALEAIGVATVGDLARIDRDRMVARFGQHGEHLRDLAVGRDEREVIPDWEAKSYSHEETFARDRAEEDVLTAVLLDQAHRVSRRLRRDAVCGRTVQIKLRDGNFRTITRQATLPAPSCDANAIYELGCELFRRNWLRTPVRLIGLGVSGIAPAAAAPLGLFSESQTDDRKRRLDETLDRLADRFGERAVLPAKVLGFRRRRDDATRGQDDAAIRRDDGGRGDVKSRRR